MFNNDIVIRWKKGTAQYNSTHFQKETATPEKKKVDGAESSEREGEREYNQKNFHTNTLRYVAMS